MKIPAGQRQFVADRDAALLSLDREKIDAYLRKYNLTAPGKENVYWAAVHKAILGLNGASEAQKERSRRWLREHGFQPELG